MLTYLLYLLSNTYLRSINDFFPGNDCLVFPQKNLPTLDSEVDQLHTDPVEARQPTLHPSSTKQVRCRRS